MYHSISDDSEDNVHPYYRINTSPSVFAMHMEFLYKNNYKVIGLDRAVRILKSSDTNCSDHLTKKPLAREIHVNEQRSGFHWVNKPNTPQNYAVLTFDDGFRDFYTEAFPILQKYGFTATVFLPTAFIDDQKHKLKGKDHLNWDEVKKLSAKAITFGSHTVSHPELYNVSWKIIRQELSDSRQRIEDELQTAVNIFCYPYAFSQEDPDFVLRFKQELLENGYHVAVTTIIGRAGHEHDPLILPRLPINQADDEKLFEAKLLGDYDWMAGAQSLVRRIKLHLRSARTDTHKVQ